MMVLQSSSFDVYKRLYDKEIGKKKNRVRNHMEGLDTVKRSSDYIYLGETISMIKETNK